MGPSIDREKVIEELEHCRQLDFEMKKPTQVAIDNALAFLKELEPVKPTYEDFFGNRIARCGKCNGYIVRYKYCPGCGQAVKWE